MQNNFNKLYKLFEANLTRIIPKIPQEKNIILAVSGGADSMALTQLFTPFAKKNNLKIHILTVDHNLRKNSFKEAKKVNAWIKTIKKRYNQIEHKILTWDKGKNVIKQGNIEAKARKARYDLITEYAAQNKIKYILTAHNKDEDIETFLINLGRGSGITGLTAIPEISTINNIKIIRPLLIFYKEELKKINSSQKQKWIEDPMNKDDKFLRVKIRKNISIIEKKFNITKDRIFLAIKNLNRAKEAIEYYTEKFMEENILFKSSEAHINLKELIQAPKEIALKSLMKTMQKIGGNKYPPRLEKLERLYQKIENKELNKTITLMNCKIKTKDNNILIKLEK